jgi:hypothetical protein
LFYEFWTWLGGPAAPLANLLQILGTASVVAGAAYGWFRHRLQHRGTVIARLQSDLDQRTRQLDQCLQNEKHLEASCAEIIERLAETVLARLDHELESGNYNAAHHVVCDWLEREGQPISALLRFEAAWATVHAAGDEHLAGLVVAEAFASAAHSICPQNTDADELAMELGKCCNNARLEGMPSF